MAKITAPMVGMLSNAEVLRVLNDRGAGAQLPGSRALASERLVYHYLTMHSPGLLELPDLQHFVNLLKPYGLSRAEVLNLLNLCPTKPVEVFLVVEDCDKRLTSEQIEEVLALVSSNLRH